MAGYIITWEDHRLEVNRNLYTHFLNQRFVDTTLQCGGANIKAHAVVLAAGSKYFDRVLKSKQDTIPIHQVNCNVLAGLLQFLYMGKTAVEEHDMPALMDAGRVLEIAGLDEINIVEESSESYIEIRTKEDVEAFLQRMELTRQQEEPEVSKVSSNFMSLDATRLSKMAEASRKALENVKKNALKSRAPGPALVQVTEDDLAAQLLVSEMEATAPQPASATPVDTEDGMVFVLEDTAGQLMIQDNGDNCFLWQDGNNQLTQLPGVETKRYESDESTQEASDMECPGSPEFDVLQQYLP